MNVQSYLSEKCAIIDSALEEFLPADEGILFEAMRYSVLNGGKRLRPILTLAACEAVGGDIETALPAACALEFIHAFSLVHDDLPALDNDDLRRGKPTTHRKFGEATAILAGDALIILAFETMLGGRDIPPQRGIEITLRIASAAGFGGMILGQAKDMSFAGRTVSPEALESMHRLKTGALIEASVVVGGILGRGADEQVDALSAYGRKIGLAFQIADDVLDIEGSEGKIGKTVGSDLRQEKSTYPKLHGLEESKDLARQAVDGAVSALDAFDEKADPLRALARYIVEREY